MSSRGLAAYSAYSNDKAMEASRGYTKYDNDNKECISADHDYSGYDNENCCADRVAYGAYGNITCVGSGTPAYRAVGSESVVLATVSKCRCDGSKVA